ncbi:MAG: hypothetical protein AAB679_00740 [Patescibacteria group bacterium]
MLYEITIYWRFTHLSRFHELAKKRKVVEIDGVGVFVYYDEQDELTNENIRKHLIGREQKTIVIEGRNPKDAVEKFYNEFEGAKIGSKNEESKALWIKKDEPILELPNCKLLYKNKNGKCTCGKPETDGNGEYGMCILENYDPPENCPISLFYKTLSSNKFSEKKEKFAKEKFTFDGKEYSVIRVKWFYNYIKYFSSTVKENLKNLD